MNKKIVFKELFGEGEYLEEYIYNIVEKNGKQYSLLYNIDNISIEDIYNSRYGFIKSNPFFPDIDIFEDNGSFYIGIEHLSEKVSSDVGEINIELFVEQCWDEGGFIPNCCRGNFRIDKTKITKYNPYGIVYIDRDMLDFAMKGTCNSCLLVSKTI